MGHHTSRKGTVARGSPPPRWAQDARTVKPVALGTGAATTILKQQLVIDGNLGAGIRAPLPPKSCKAQPSSRCL